MGGCFVAGAESAARRRGCTPVPGSISALASALAMGGDFAKMAAVVAERAAKIEEDRCCETDEVGAVEDIVLVGWIDVNVSVVVVPVRRLGRWGGRMLLSLSLFLLIF